MHTGRTIQELIELVQRIYTNTGNRPRPARDLAATDRNALDRHDQPPGEHLTPSHLSKVSAVHQPVWLAVFR